MSNILDPLDVIGKVVMGDLWRTFYLSIQDAIALGCLLQIPSLIGKVIIGREFSSFKVCLLEDPLGVNRYACFIIVISDFCLWAVLAGRILVRLKQDLVSLVVKKESQHGSKP